MRMNECSENDAATEILIATCSAMLLLLARCVIGIIVAVLVFLLLRQFFSAIVALVAVLILTNLFLVGLFLNIHSTR